MDSKIRKRKFNKHPSKETTSQKIHHFSKHALQAIDLSKTISGLLIFLSAILFAKLYFSFPADNTFVPFDGNASFPTNVLLEGQYWSSLLSGHYFGLRAAEPNSPIVSLMWFRNRLDNHGLPIRHWCNHDDKLAKFFWNYNDLKFGCQSIVDQNLQINTSFIKVGRKVIKSKISIVDTSKRADLNSIILYSAIENNDDMIEALNLHSFADNTVFAIKTQSKTSGNYSLKFKVTQGNPVARSYLNANSTLDQLKETVLKNLYVYKDAESSKSIFMVANADQKYSNFKNNFIAYQIVFKNYIDVEMEMQFEGQSAIDEFDYEHELNKRKAEFDLRFEEKFGLKQKHLASDLIGFARAVLSNTIGGISYFFGTSLVQSRLSPAVKPYGPIQLLTAVPSRSFFPRGFLWDEGFHQLLISAWDPELSMVIIQSWFGLMNKDGWIPREIVLGDEAKARVPQEYLVQYSTNANPPAFFLAVESLIDNEQANIEWLRHMYPRLKSWYHWFNSSQTGNYPTTFRWRGRNSTTNLELNPKTMASGFDDFPRATHPSEEEIHLDLRCWMALASRVMAKIAKVLAIEDSSYDRFYKLLSDNSLLEQWHWSSEHNMFCDKGLNSDDVQLIRTIRNEQELVERRVNQPPKYGCVPHRGYVSLFPFIMNLLEPSNSKLELILQDIQSPEVLWSPYGLRSTSKGDFYYDKFNTKSDGPYWRGTIWINVNYLVLKALHHYAKLQGPYQEQMHAVYVRLRENLINNVHNEYLRTGYLWEQYSDKTGNGIGTFPFTGWSALIVRIMAEKY